MAKVVCDNYKIGQCRLGWKCPDSHRWDNPISIQPTQSQTITASNQPIAISSAAPPATVTNTTPSKPNIPNREVITINIGEAGINFGDTVWIMEYSLPDSSKMSY